jgi:MinD superfamily P-loop ATPase
MIMALCTISDVRAIVDPKTLTDANITSIIQHAESIVVLTTGGSSSSTDTRLVIACTHLAVAMTIQKMKFTGELAAQIKMGSESQSNSVDADIQKHEKLAEKYMKQYRFAVSGYSVLYGRAGIKTVNSED